MLCCAVRVQGRTAAGRGPVHLPGEQHPGASPSLTHPGRAQ
jgi:hypothetical protein